MKLAKWCLPLLLAACGGPPPPRTISVAPELPEQVQIAAAVARDAWCAAPVGWCPELVEGMGDAEIRVEPFPDAFDGIQGHVGAGAHNDGAFIAVAPAVIDGFTDLSGALTHEFGHFGIDGHVPTSALMHARFATAADVPTVVDVEASAEWCSQQGC